MTNDHGTVVKMVHINTEQKSKDSIRGVEGPIDPEIANAVERSIIEGKKVDME